MSHSTVPGSNSHIKVMLIYHVLAAPSVHFGCDGELWDPRGRLPSDWSFAGYHFGDDPLPLRGALPILADLKRDYGAVGDGETDDSAALQKAFQDVNRVSCKLAALVTRKSAAVVTHGT